MENKILEAVEDMEGQVYKSLGEARVHYSQRELLDIWLRYEGIIGYTDTILSAMISLGYSLDIEDDDFFQF